MDKLYGICIVILLMIYSINFGYVYGSNDVQVNKLKTLEFSNFNTEELPIQYHISQIMANKYQVILNDKNYTVFYELSNLNTSSYDYDAKISNISMEPNKNSMIIHLDNILQTDEMSIRFNTEIILAENGNFSLVIDGVEKQYALNTFKPDVVMSFIIPKGSHQVEIGGSRVIPEFNSILSMVYIISIMGVVIISKKAKFIQKIS